MTNPLPKDDLAGDLLAIVKHDEVNTGSIGTLGEEDMVNVDALMQKLTMYIVARDHKVFRHAFKLGQKNILNKSRIGAN